MEYMQISLAQVAGEQCRNEQRHMHMDMLAMSPEEIHSELQEEKCNYAEAHLYAEEENEDSYPGSADALVDDPTAAQLEVLMRQMQELEIFIDAYAESQQELTGNYNIGLFKPCPEEDDYEDDITLGQCNYGYEGEQYEGYSYDQGHPFAEEETEDPYPGYVDVLVGTSTSGDFCVQALDPSNAMDLDSGHDTTPDEDTSNLPLLCVMDPVSDAVSDAEDDYMWDEDAGEPMYDIPDQQYGMYNMAPAFYSTKRVADNLPPRRAPIKRVAFDPSTFGTSGAAPARNPATAPPHGNPLPQNPRPVPQNPRAVPVPQRNQGSQRPAAPAAKTNDPLQPPAPHHGSSQGAGPSQQRAAAPDPARRADLVPDLPADALVNPEGVEVALTAAHSLTIDAAPEANSIVPAAEICAGDHLLNDQGLEDKGKEAMRPYCFINGRAWVCWVTGKSTRNLQIFMTSKCHCSFPLQT